MTNQPKLTTVAKTEPATRGALYRIKTSKQKKIKTKNQMGKSLNLSVF